MDSDSNIIILYIVPNNPICISVSECKYYVYIYCVCIYNAVY